MEERICRIFTEVLKKELVPALGCTEPIAVAYAAAKAREVLGEFPERIEIECSGNIVKNVMGVTVPNSDGMKGIGAAAVLGVTGGDASRELEVLNSVTPEDIARTRELLAQGFYKGRLQSGVDNLYIVAKVFKEEHSASVTIINRHTLITSIEKDGERIFHRDPVRKKEETDWSEWSIQKIIEYANGEIDPEVRSLIETQIDCNTKISQYGLSHPIGARVGSTLLRTEGSYVAVRARAKAAAGSDARMGGCAMPVVINSGSGNQGMTVCMPVLEYAKEYGSDPDTTIRALIISNLVSVYQKHFIGSLSAFCGAVTAAAGAGAGITYLVGGTRDQICHTIINTIANVGGILCDGAKASCAAKIAAAVEAASLGHCLSMQGHVFLPGEGVVKNDIEETIRAIGTIGRLGMKETDETILQIMMNDDPEAGCE